MPTRLFNRHEWPAVALAFTWFFCLLGAYYVIRPVREQLAAAVGSTALPVFYAATLAATLILTPIFGALVARLRRAVFVPVVYLFFTLGMLAFIPAFQLQDAIGAKLLGSVFFVWVSVFNLFVVAVFWSFIADVFDPGQAYRLFPVIGLGGVLGAIAGPTLTRVLNPVVGVSGLLVVSSALLLACLGCLFGLLAWARRHPVAGDTRRDRRVIGGSFIAGAIETVKSPLMRRLAILMLLGDAVGTVIYALLADYSGATYPTREARIDFAASVDLGTNLLQAAFQLGIARTLMMRFGPAPALALDGAIKALMLALLALLGGPWIVAAVVVTRASAYGIFKPAADALYTRVDAETRYKTKGFIDTAVWRLGDLTVASALSGLMRLGAGLPLLAGITTLAAAASGLIGWQAAHSRQLQPTEPPADGSAQARL